MVDSQTREAQPSSALYIAETPAEKAVADGVRSGECSFCSSFGKIKKSISDMAGEIAQQQRNFYDEVSAGWRLGKVQDATSSGITETMGHMREASEGMIKNTRKINDLIRDRGWQLSTAYTQSAMQAVKRRRFLVLSPLSSQK